MTERSSVIEQARTDVLGYQAENKDGDLDKTQLKVVLDTYFKDVPDLTDMSDTEIKEKQLETKPKYGTHTITVSEIYNGSLSNTTPSVATDYSNEVKIALEEGKYVTYKNKPYVVLNNNDDGIEIIAMESISTKLLRSNNGMNVEETVNIEYIENL